MSYLSWFLDCFFGLSPWQIFALLYLIWIGALPIGRKIFERCVYNISLASQYGDPALVAGVMIAVGIIQRQSGPWWFDRWQVYIAITLSISIVGGLLFWLSQWSADWDFPLTDQYHAVIIIPTVMFLALFVSVPTIYWYGTITEKIAGLICGLIWVVLLIIDIQTGRIHQQDWIKSHDITM